MKTAQLERAKARFEAKVAKDVSGCWIWLGATDGRYGAFWFKGRQMGAHRASYEIYKGEVPPGLVVRHACDNPACVNPEHLSVGTHAENTQDMISRGRQRSGTAKLNDDQVRAIRAEYVKRDGELPRLAEKYGVSVSTIWAVVHHQNWNAPDLEPVVRLAAGSDFESKRARGSKHHRAKLSEADVREIRRLKGRKLDDVAAKFGIKKAQVSAIQNRKAWAHVPDESALARHDALLAAAAKLSGADVVVLVAEAARIRMEFTAEDEIAYAKREAEELAEETAFFASRGLSLVRTEELPRRAEDDVK